MDFELNFLIVKFLREGTCPEAARLLEEELNKHCRGLLPPRLDWEGNPHHQTIHELERQYPHVGADHLSILCSRLRLRPGASHHSLLSHPLPRRPPPRIWQPPGILSHHQITGFQHSLSVYTIMYKRLRMLRRNLGHLSSVFCLLFDKTGQFVFTGADDLLVKMWSTHTGRLYFTFRGASSEISDMAVSEDNRMLAAGSTDKIIRVWCLLSGAPVAVLTKHTGTITALHFCPAAAPGASPYLAATSGDGTVSFWSFSYNDQPGNRAIFDPEPTRYREKVRWGKYQTICADFSPGGLFLATGSEDHHVRVYIMDGQDGPVKVLEKEAHTERVDSIQWGNSPQLRFISGSMDGTARLWSYRAGQWGNVVLKMYAEDGRTVHYNKDKDVDEALRVTMVSWNSNDTKVITAVSDSTLCVWDPVTAVMIARLKGHKDEVYVLESHPSMPEFLMSGAHDGNLIIWDISTNDILFQHYNYINEQGHGAVYDAKWSPDSLNIAASDSHGHVLFFGMTSKQPYEACPVEMFFHTDYRPLLRDTSHHVVDEQTQCAPHLLPPPFLVDIEGKPYSADIQKLVPGREHLSDKEALVPNLTDGSRPLSPPPAEHLLPTEPIHSSNEHPESAAFAMRDSGESTGSGEVRAQQLWRRELVPSPRGAMDDKATVRKFAGLQENEMYKLESKRKRQVSLLGQGQRETEEVVDWRRGRRTRGMGVRTQAASRQSPSVRRPTTTDSTRSDPQEDNKESIDSDHSEDDEFRAASDSSLGESSVEASSSENESYRHPSKKIKVRKHIRKPWENNESTDSENVYDVLSKIAETEDVFSNL